MDVNFEDKDADVVIECTFTEQALLWQLYAPESTDRVYDIISEWSERLCGVNRTVANVVITDKDSNSREMPICVNLSYVLIKTNRNKYLRVVFYEATSVVVDHDIVEAYIKARFSKKSAIFLDASTFSHIDRF